MSGELRLVGLHPLERGERRGTAQRLTVRSLQSGLPHPLLDVAHQVERQLADHQVAPDPLLEAVVEGADLQGSLHHPPVRLDGRELPVHPRHLLYRERCVGLQDPPAGPLPTERHLLLQSRSETLDRRLVEAHVEQVEQVSLPELRLDPLEDFVVVLLPHLGAPRSKDPLALRPSPRQRGELLLAPLLVEQHHVPSLVEHHLPRLVPLAHRRDRPTLRGEEHVLDIRVPFREDPLEPVGGQVRGLQRALHPPVADIDAPRDAKDPGQTVAHRADRGVVLGVAREELDRDRPASLGDHHPPLHPRPVRTTVRGVAGERRELALNALHPDARGVVEEHLRAGTPRSDHLPVDLALEGILVDPQLIESSVERVVVQSVDRKSDKEGRRGVLEPLGEDAPLRERVGEAVEHHELDERLVPRLVRNSVESLQNDAMEAQFPPEEVAEGFAAVGSRNSAPSFRETFGTLVVSRWRVRYDGPLKWSTRPRSSTRSKIASARSASCNTRPQSSTGLFVVNTIGRR